MQESKGNHPIGRDDFASPRSAIFKTPFALPATGTTGTLSPGFRFPGFQAIARTLQTRRLGSGLKALLCLILLFVIYRPILPGTFLMDDRKLIQWDNPLVTGKLGPAEIWFRADFPLSTLAFWLQWKAWGENPAGYHAVNILLHGLSAFLIWRVLKYLTIPGAWLAAVLFAVHPVCVASIGRIAEFKNTFSLPFFLLSLLAYLHYDSLQTSTPKSSPTPHRLGRFHAPLNFGLSLSFFVLALFSKTSTVMLPPVLLACALWQRRRLSRNDLIQTSPFFLLALGFGFTTIWFQKYQALAGETVPIQSFGTRIALSGKMIWFYLEKALLPLNLNVVYPPWKVDAKSWLAYLPVCLFIAALLACWQFRRGWGKHALFGLACFAITLFPALGFFDSQFLMNWQVSDHLQYLSLAAPLALVAAALASSLTTSLLNVAAIFLIFSLSLLSFQRAHLFANEERLLRDTLQKNPTASAAHNDLGCILARQNKVSEGITHFQSAVQLKPEFQDAQLNLGQALSLRGNFAEAESHFQVALKLKPNSPDAHHRYGSCLASHGRHRDAVHHLKTALSLKSELETRMELAALLNQGGQTAEAIAQLREVIVQQPDSPSALNNLAWLLATTWDEHLRNGKESLHLAKRACRLTGFQQPPFVGTLAAAYAEAGRFAQATSTAKMALRMQTTAGDDRSAAISRQLLALYGNGTAWHDSPPVKR